MKLATTRQPSIYQKQIEEIGRAIKYKAIYTTALFLTALFVSKLTYGQSPSSSERGKGDQALPRETIQIQNEMSIEPSARTSQRDWNLDATLGVPIRGFNVQTGAKEPETQDPLNSVSYSPSPSLEGTVFLSYRDLGFSYRHTLAAASLDLERGLPASVNEEYRFSLLLERHLFELSRQNLIGLQTSLVTDQSGMPKSLARPDIVYTDWRAKWMGGLPIWGAQRPNSLANFYTEAELESDQIFSFDLLYGVQLMEQKISASSPFIPIERQAAFGAGVSLREVSSKGLGAGAGPGLTVLMGRKSYFSMAALVGGSYNISQAAYSNRQEDISGFGTFASVRLSARWVFGNQSHQSVGFRLLADSWIIPAKEEEVSSSDSMMSVNYGVNF